METLISECNIFLVIAFLAAGFFCLIKGADIFVDGSSNIAGRFGIPSGIIGLTIVAVGTSLPETSVSLAASIAKNNEIAVSNVIGSNIFNLMVVIGSCAVFAPVAVKKNTLKYEIPFSALCALLLLFCGVAGFSAGSRMNLNRHEGIIFLIIFFMYMTVLVKKAVDSSLKNASEKGKADDVKSKKFSLEFSLACIAAGIAAIAVGGNLTVYSASRIARELGMTETFIGLTIVAIGTSLPELATSVAAARKHEVELALGNAIGSSIFNILFVLGLSSAICGMDFVFENIIDLIVLLMFTALVWVFARTKSIINRVEGLFMLGLYASYFVYIIQR